jgi:transcriptional regulator with XRE-family HTH domain
MLNESKRMETGLRTPGGRSLRELREDLGLTQAELGRALGFSTRWVAAQEATETQAPEERRVMELARLYEGLCRVVQPESIKGWLLRPNQAFEGMKPLEVVERGQIDRLWEMIFYLESGLAS